MRQKCAGGWGERSAGLASKTLRVGVICNLILLKEKNPVFIKKWTKQLNYYENLKANLNKAKNKDEAKISQIDDLIEMIEEVLK